MLCTVHLQWLVLKKRPLLHNAVMWLVLAAFDQLDLYFRAANQIVARHNILQVLCLQQHSDAPLTNSMHAQVHI